MVSSESADLSGAVVASEQQQLRDHRSPYLLESLRDEPGLFPAELLREEQALDPQIAGRRASRLRLSGKRSAAGSPSGALACVAEAGGGDFAGAGRVHDHDARETCSGARWSRWPRWRKW